MKRKKCDLFPKTFHSQSHVIKVPTNSLQLEDHGLAWHESSIINRQEIRTDLDDKALEAEGRLLASEGLSVSPIKLVAL